MTFDHLLADYIREQAGISDRSDARVQRELLDAAIEAKMLQSDAESVSVNVAGWRGGSLVNSLTGDPYGETHAVSLPSCAKDHRR